MDIQLIKILFLVFASISIQGKQFLNGVHIENKENKSYIIKFKYSAMTTKICDIKKPNKKIKNGIVSVVDRKTKNLKIITKIKEENFPNYKITAEINKKSIVNCICVRACEIKIKNIGKKYLKSGDILVIENGKLRVK